MVSSTPSAPATTEEEMMSDQFVMPDPADYDNDDFQTSTGRVRKAKASLLQDERAAEAHRKLGEEIAKRVDRKRATLAQVRQAVGLTQTQLAETMALSQGDVSRLE